MNQAKTNVQNERTPFTKSSKKTPKKKIPPSSKKSYKQKLFTSPEGCTKASSYNKLFMSPRSKEKFYKKFRDEDRVLKEEIRELFARFLVKEPGAMKSLLLEKNPLVKLYDMFMEVKYSSKNDSEGSSGSLILLSD